MQKCVHKKEIEDREKKLIFIKILQVDEPNLDLRTTLTKKGLTLVKNKTRQKKPHNSSHKST